MNSWQEDIIKLHEAFDAPRPSSPTLKNFRFLLRCRLIMEEAREIIDAAGFREEIVDGKLVLVHKTLGRIVDTDPNLSDIEQQIRDTKMQIEMIRQCNWPQMIREIIDLLVVTVGAGVEMGATLSPFWDEVQRANISKVGGPVRGDGKQLKPEGWKPPNIERILADLIGTAPHHE